jgi:hypothetical protein
VLPDLSALYEALEHRCTVQVETAGVGQSLSGEGFTTWPGSPGVFLKHLY